MRVYYDDNNGFMNYEPGEDPVKRVLSLLLVYVIAIVLGFLLCVLYGCKHVEYVESTTIRTDTLREVRFVKDSIFVKDSTAYVPATDTTAAMLVKTRYIYKYIEKTDTVTEAKVDTVVKFVEKPARRESQETDWWRAFKWLQSFVIVGFILAWIARVLKKA